MRHCRATLLVSTYQAGKLGVIGCRDGKLELSFVNFPQAMGLAVGPQGIAIGTRSQIWFMASMPELGPRLPPAGRFDGCYVARRGQVTGSIQVHEMVWSDGDLWAVNTLFSCLCTLHTDFSFLPRWQPAFVSQLAAEDRCHLNGVALRDGRPRYVSAMSETDTPAGWRPTKATSGVLIDINSNEIVARGLAMPHSPRWYADKLWVLDSGRGRISVAEPSTQSTTEVAKLPGYTRGLAFHGQFAFVGLSRIRETAVFGGLPIQGDFDELKCGIAIVDLVSGKNVAAFQFHSGVEEIFDIQVIPGVLNPCVVGPDPSEDDAQPVWVVPPPERVADLLKASPAPVFPAGIPPSSPTEAPVLREDPHALMRRGLRFHEVGRLQEAAASYRAALDIAPHYADVYINLGNLMQDMHQRDEAITCYRRALDLQPNSVNAYRNLGYVLKERGDLDEGIALLRRAQEIEPSDVIRYVMATTLPPVYQSHDDLVARRRRLEQNVSELITEGFQLDISHHAAPTMFYAAYQGYNDCDLQRQLAGLLRPPPLEMRERLRIKGSRIQIGFISRHFRNHTIGRLNIGTVQHLPRDRFEVFVISVGHHDDLFAQRFRQAADHYLALPTNLSQVREQTAGLNLDILVFADVGMDTLTYSLCMSRLAPIQCVTWGHPVTTGSPAVDYFISSEMLETEEAAQHYTERLALLKRMNVCYERPAPPTRKRPEDFGLNPNSNLYLCFQSLFKIHPDFDAVLHGILARDPAGEIVMMQGQQPEWTHLLQQRFQRTLGEHARRVKFLSAVPHPDFMSLNALAAVSLDPLHFGGGNTTYEALAVGLPVITWPSPYLRGRISQALYKQMGYEACVVPSVEAFVDLAVTLGTDRAKRASVSRDILSACGVLYDDRAAIAELADLFESMA